MFRARIGYPLLSACGSTSLGEDTKTSIHCKLLHSLFVAPLMLSYAHTHAGLKFEPVNFQLNFLFTFFLEKVLVVRSLHLVLP